MAARSKYKVITFYWLLLIFILMVADRGFCQESAQEKDNEDVQKIQKILEFAECWQQVQKNNLALMNAEIRLKEAVVAREAAENVFYPSVSFDLGLSANNLEDDNSEVSFQYAARIDPILDGYAKFFASDLAELQYDSGTIRREKVMGLLRYQTAEAYLLLIAIKRAGDFLYQAIIKQEARLENNDLTLSREEAILGKISRQRTVGRDKLALKRLEAVSFSWKQRLNNLMLLSPDASYLINSQSSVEGIINLSREETTDLENDWLATSQARMHQLQINMVKAREKLTDLDGYPKPFLRLGWSEGQVDQKSGAYVSGGFTIPLWDWGRNERSKTLVGLEKRRLERKQHESMVNWQNRLAAFEYMSHNLRDQEQLLEENIHLLKQQTAVLSQLRSRQPSSRDKLLEIQAQQSREQAQLELLHGKIWVMRSQLETSIRMGELNAE